MRSCKSCGTELMSGRGPLVGSRGLKADKGACPLASKCSCRRSRFSEVKDL